MVGLRALQGAGFSVFLLGLLTFAGAAQPAGSPLDRDLFEASEEPPQENAANAVDFVALARDLCRAARSFADEDYTTASSLLRPWAEGGEPVAQALLAEAYIRASENLRKETDPTKQAHKWFQMAMDQGHAMGLHGAIQAIFGREGLPDWYVQAFTKFPSTAGESAAEALAFVGGLYHINAEYYSRRLDDETKKTAKWKNTDCLRALEWFERAAILGHRETQTFLYTAYSEGWCGTTNPSRGIYWLQAAAEGGFATAQYNLGLC